MYDATFEPVVQLAQAAGAWLRLGGAVVGAGVAVKLMDDALDGRRDRAAGWVTAAQRLGPAAFPYGLLALASAFVLKADAAAALFFSAYATGMAHDGAATMPTGLPGWVESSGATLAAVAAAGVPLAGAAFGLMVFIQCLDDIVDETEDRRTGARNVAYALGAVEAHFLAAAAWLVAVSLSPRLALATALGMALLERLFRPEAAGTPAEGSGGRR